jgi:hypothetical protein
MHVASFPWGGLGLFLFALVFCLGLVWLIFPFVAMKRLRRLHREIERCNQRLANLSGGTSPPPAPSPRPTARMVPTARAASPPSVVPLKISMGGKAHKLRDTTSIKIMLQSGELSLQDRYYDRKKNEWVTLDCHPEIRQ